MLLRLLRPYLVRQRELETLLVVMGLNELERSRDRLEDAVQQLQSLAAELHAKPYTADEVADGGSPYAAFEDVFRGPEERVRELLEPYVELLRGHEPVARPRLRAGRAARAALGGAASRPAGSTSTREWSSARARKA